MTKILTKYILSPTNKMENLKTCLFLNYDDDEKQIDQTIIGDISRFHIIVYGNIEIVETEFFISGTGSSFLGMSDDERGFEVSD